MCPRKKKVSQPIMERVRYSKCGYLGNECMMSDRVKQSNLVWEVVLVFGVVLILQVSQFG